MSAGAIIKGISVLAKVDISATLTAFTDQTACSITVTPRLLEAVSSSGNLAWVGRDNEVLDWSGTITVMIITAADAAAEEVRSTAIAGTSDIYSFTIPHTSPTVLTGTAFTTFTGSAQVGSYYTETYDLVGDGALNES